jgi:hypothetical protein
MHLFVSGLVLRRKLTMSCNYVFQILQQQPVVGTRKSSQVTIIASTVHTVMNFYGEARTHRRSLNQSQPPSWENSAAPYCARPRDPVVMISHLT